MAVVDKVEAGYHPNEILTATGPVWSSGLKISRKLHQQLVLNITTI